jgi:hypothetical protein
MDQIIYDYMEPVDDPDVPQLEHVEKAMEYLEEAAKAYRSEPPHYGAGAGYVEDAIFELNKVN